MCSPRKVKQSLEVFIFAFTATYMGGHTQYIMDELNTQLRGAAGVCNRKGQFQRWSYYRSRFLGATLGGRLCWSFSQSHSCQNLLCCSCPGSCFLGAHFGKCTDVRAPLEAACVGATLGAVRVRAFCVVAAQELFSRSSF